MMCAAHLKIAYEHRRDNSLDKDYRLNKSYQFYLSPNYNKSPTNPIQIPLIIKYIPTSQGTT